MTYTRGSNDDYDRWANLTEDDTWSWDNLNDYYLRVRYHVVSYRIGS